MPWDSVPEFDHWETGQFGMQVAPWDDLTAMIKNSPNAKIYVIPAARMVASAQTVAFHIATLSFANAENSIASRPRSCVNSCER